jgi:hypothetical protein
MRFFHRTFVEKAIGSLNIAAERLGDDEAQATWAKLRSTYFRDGLLIDDAGLFCNRGWEHLKAMPFAPPYLLAVLDSADDRGLSNIASIWQINSLSELNELIGDTPDFEFFVWDEDCQYVINYEDHGVLCGAGAAKQWVETLKSKYA